MQTHLNLPPFNYQIKKEANKTYLFDIIRKKYVHLTPEEWVRQHVIHYLITHLGYPQPLITLEKNIQKTASPTLRPDIIVYSPSARPLILIECKASKTPIAEKTLQQVVRYNTQQAPFLLLTNGINHLCLHMHPSKKTYTISHKIPAAKELLAPLP